MDEKNQNYSLPEPDFLAEQPPMDTFTGGMPQLELGEEEPELFLAAEIPEAQPEEVPIVFDEAFLAMEVPMDDEPPIQLSPAADPDPVEPPSEAAAEPQIPFPSEEDSADESVTDALDISFPGEAAEPMDLFPDDSFRDDTFRDDAFRETGEDEEDFRSAFEENAEEAPIVPSSGRVRPARKGRPRRKKGYGLFGIPHILATVVWLAIILVIGTTLGRFLWVCAADVLAFGRESNKVSVTITTNDTIEDIAQKLHDAGLVRYPQLFELYAGIAVDEGDIIPGTFEMDTLYDYHALVVQMGPRSSNRAVVEDVLIPEGYNCRQIFALLEEKGICTVEELEEYAANGEFADFWFLEGVERGDKYCLEGFLFPDTYDFYANSTPREALGKMLLGFEDRFTEEIYSQLPALNQRLSDMMRRNGCSEEMILDNILDLRELLTVASLIEEETSSSKESPTIASVIYNRYTQDLVYERYLGIDAAIIYATGDASNIDTSIDNPYNTYIYAGLTPGPISNPGLDSIKAALNFADTNYYYYVLNPETRTHDFSVTLEEHERKVEKYKEMTAGEDE